MREGHKLSFNLEVCCPKGGLSGHERFIDQPVERFIAILVHNSSKKGVGEMDSSESTSIKCTKLRRHACLFCGDLKTCIGRHLQKVHGKEDAVKEFINKKGVEKIIALCILRLQSDKMYNETVPRQMRIAVRKPVVQLVSESLHCSTCNGLIARKYFSKHHRKCSNRQPDNVKRIRFLEFEELNKSSVSLDENILKELLSNL